MVSLNLLRNTTLLTQSTVDSTWLELPWLLPAEINPNAIRANANAISTMSNWGWNCGSPLFLLRF